MRLIAKCLHQRLKSYHSSWVNFIKSFLEFFLLSLSKLKFIHSLLHKIKHVLSLAFIVKLYRHLWFKYISLFLIMKINKVWKSLFSLIDLKKSKQLVKISINPILCIKYICKRSLAMCLCWSWQIKHAFKSLSFLWRLSCWTLCFLVFNSSFDPFNSTFFIEILISWLFSFQRRLMLWDSSNLYFISITYINQLFGWVLC